MSRVVEKNLAEFNVEGKGSAVVIDALVVCVVSLNPTGGSSPLFYVTLECLDPKDSYQSLVWNCCAKFGLLVAGCALACYASGGIGFLACVVLAIPTAGDSLIACKSGCPSMNVCVYNSFWSKIGCRRAW